VSVWQTEGKYMRDWGSSLFRVSYFGFRVLRWKFLVKRRNMYALCI